MNALDMVARSMAGQSGLRVRSEWTTDAHTIDPGVAHMVLRVKADPVLLTDYPVVWLERERRAARRQILRGTLTLAWCLGVLGLLMWMIGG